MQACATHRSRAPRTSANRLLTGMSQPGERRPSARRASGRRPALLPAGCRAGHRVGAARRLVLPDRRRPSPACLLTPCVLPMLPIVSSIIVGRAGGPPSPVGGRGGHRRDRLGDVCRGFGLAAAYSFGMAGLHPVRHRRGAGRRGPRRGRRTRGCSAPSRSAWWPCRFDVRRVHLHSLGGSDLQVSRRHRRSPGGPGRGRLRDGRVSALIVSPSSPHRRWRFALPEPDPRRLARRHRAVLPAPA